MTGRGRVRLRTARLVGVVAATVLFVLASTCIGVLTPGYDALAETVSRLGSAGQPHAAWTRALFGLYGALMLLGAVPLGAVVPGRRRWLAALVAVYAAAAVVTGLAPKDPPAVPTTTASEIHVGATLVGGAAILAAMVVVARGARRRIDRRVAALVAAWTATGVVVFRFSWGSAYYGLVERSFLIVTMVWLAGLALRLLADGPDDDAQSGRLPVAALVVPKSL